MIQAMPPPTLTLSPLFSDGMVLQRRKPIPIFGTDAPGTTVTVRLGPDMRRTKAGPDGRWRVKMPKREAGGPHVVAIDGTVHKDVRDVLIGEVWIASGQSNMEWSIDAGTNIDDAKTDTPNAVRMFTVQKATAAEPQSSLRGGWQAAAPETVGGFSAVGYVFARRLHKELGIPIGVIHTSWGGTNAESWTSFEALAADPVTRILAERYTASMKDYPGALAKYAGEIGAVQNRIYPEFAAPGEFAEWAKPEFDDAAWEAVAFPHLWPTTLDGVAWYRVTVDLTAEEAARGQTLRLGPIDDLDVTYVNGVEVGHTDLATPNFYTADRSYAVPVGTLKAGRNVIAIRVFDLGGGGGFGARPEEIRLGDKPLAQARMKMERVYEKDLRVGTGFPTPPVGANDPNMPTALYNAMIAPFVGYGIQGAIWYQGENNAGRAEQYRTLFPLMIEDWRARWKRAGDEGNFPFYWVSLANFMARRDEPVESAWAELREAQRETLSLPHTGQAIILDAGDADDIHPRRKREVGERLALQALSKTYRVKGISDGPFPNALTAGGGKITLRYAGQRIRTSDGKAPRGFWVAGQDGKWTVATAEIRGDFIVLNASGVTEPKYVRYGWADNPDVNLIGPTDLPAAPFRTDFFRFSTVDNR